MRKPAGSLQARDDKIIPVGSRVGVRNMKWNSCVYQFILKSVLFFLFSLVLVLVFYTFLASFGF